MSLLSISEKREWLAKIFRDKTGEYTDADKFKAMEADNRLAMLQYAEDRNKDVTAKNPTAIPCGNYSEKKDDRKEPARKQPATKEDDFDINIPWAMETFLGMN